MDNRVEIVPATSDLATPFFDGPPPHRLRAWVGLVDGQAAGLGGIYYLEDNTRVAFITLSPEGYKHPKALVKTAHAFLQMLRKEGVPRVIAVADPSIEASERFLLHFGFKPGGNVKGQTIYVWTK